MENTIKYLIFRQNCFLNFNNYDVFLTCRCHSINDTIPLWGIARNKREQTIKKQNNTKNHISTLNYFSGLQIIYIFMVSLFVFFDQCGGGAWTKETVFNILTFTKKVTKKCVNNNGWKGTAVYRTYNWSIPYNIECAWNFVGNHHICLIWKTN